MTTTTKQRESFIASMQREFPEDHQTLERCRSIMRGGATLHRLAEDTCNVPMNDKQQAAADLKEEQAEMRIVALCNEFPKRWCVTRVDHNGNNKKMLFTTPTTAYLVECNSAHARRWLLDNQSGSIHHATTHEGYAIEEIGVSPDFSGDPRGHTVKLVVPSGRYDDWGGTGICVPTS